MTVPTITDDLVAELQSELGQILRIADSVGGACNLSAVGIGSYLRLAGPSTVLALLEANRKLRSERAELKRDAERYRDLRERAVQDVDGYLSETPVIVYANNYSEDWRERIDAAIDAAMQEQPS